MLGSKHGIALAAALLMMVFAVPRLPVSGETELETVFTASWLVFAYLVIAANWRMVLKLDREERRRDEDVRRKRWLRAQQQRETAWSRKRAGRLP